MPLFSPKDAICVEWLEVDPEDHLDHPSAYVISGRQILIGDGGLTKSRRGKISHAGIRGSLAANFEVDVIERIEELGAKFHVHSFGNLRLLDHTYVKARQWRTMKNEVGESALAYVFLYAPVATWRCDVPAGGCTQGGEARRGYVVSAPRIQDYVIR